MAEHEPTTPGAQSAEHADPSPGPIWMIAFIGAVLVIVISLGIVGLYHSAKQEEVEQKVYRQPGVQFEQLRQQQLKALQREAHWVERPPAEGEDGQTQRRLAIPIDQAMRRIVEEHGGEQTAMK